MKKERIMINGVKYRYIITEENTIKVDGIVSYDNYQLIKETLIKKGKYKENSVETIKVEYDENYLKRRFQKWATIELKLYLEELEENHKKGILTPNEKLCVQPIREEIQRRMKNDN